MDRKVREFVVVLEDEGGGYVTVARSFERHMQGDGLNEVVRSVLGVACLVPGFL